jgi:uncharacterized protein (TIGR02452 family)
MAANLYLWRIDIWKETQEAAYKHGAPPSLRFDPRHVKPVKNKGFSTLIDVVDQDCLEVAHAMKGAGMRPVVLNLSDDSAAGGAVDLGSGAQEESLWRRTALCVTQTQGFYPLDSALIYSSAVAVLRDTEAKNYAWLPEPWTVDFIACPAIKYPKWIQTPESPDGDLNDADKAALEQRLRFILDVAAQMGNTAVVLGPMGCGAWRNPPHAVANVFNKVLPDYKGVFQAIIVAALTTGDRGGTSNASIFRGILRPGGGSNDRRVE